MFRLMNFRGRTKVGVFSDAMGKVYVSTGYEKDTIYIEYMNGLDIWRLRGYEIDHEHLTDAIEMAAEILVEGVLYPIKDPYWRYGKSRDKLEMDEFFKERETSAISDF